MYVHSIENLHLGEIKLIRKALDDINIQGRDARFVATLQDKLNASITEIEAGPPKKPAKAKK